MLYPYGCQCGNEWEVIKSVRHIDDPENCPSCNALGKRFIAKTQSFYGADDWNTSQYCPGLGQMVKSNKHRRQLAKARGLEEVGTEDVSKIAKEYERDVEKEKEKGYEEAGRLAYNHGFNQ